MYVSDGGSHALALHSLTFLSVGPSPLLPPPAPPCRSSACLVTTRVCGALFQDPGRIPRTIECELTQDLVDSVVPGDLVTVAGIVKAVNTEVGVVPPCPCTTSPVAT